MATPAFMHLNFLALRLYKFILLPAKQVALFSPLLAILLVNSTSCSWLQCGLVCVVLLNCCLATFIVEPSWLLLSTVSNLFPSSSVQGVGDVFPLRIDVWIWRSIVKKLRKANGEQFGNLSENIICIIRASYEGAKCRVLHKNKLYIRTFWSSKWRTSGQYFISGDLFNSSWGPFWELQESDEPWQVFYNI